MGTCVWVPTTARDAPVEVPAQRDFFRGRFGVHVDEDDFGFDFFQEVIGRTKWIFVRRHEHTSLQIDDGVWNFAFAA